MISFAFNTAFVKDPFKAEYDRICCRMSRFARHSSPHRRGQGKNEDCYQGQVARRMGTTQSAVARMESGNGLPFNPVSLVKYAQAVGRELKIALS